MLFWSSRVLQPPILPIFWDAFYLSRRSTGGYFCFNPPSNYPRRGKREGNDNNKLTDDDDDDYEVRRSSRVLLLRYYCTPKLDSPRYAR